MKVKINDLVFVPRSGGVKGFVTYFLNGRVAITFRQDGVLVRQWFDADEVARVRV